MQITPIKLTIKGRVQGVFFRIETQKTARGLNLNGYVKNLPDGSVEAFFQGDDDRVQKMVEWCHTGPSGARVFHVIPEKVPLSPNCEGFEILY